ncbi:MAG: hypothetical protein WBZ28_12300 [Pseudolabrys sp.]
MTALCPNSIPATAMADAFLIALARWAERHASTDRITLPTGIVTAGELVLVLRALRLTRELGSAP